MKFLEILAFLFFIVSSFVSNVVLGYLLLLIVFLIVFFISKKSLRFMGGFKFWIFPAVFLFIMSFDLNTFRLLNEKLISNTNILVHLYIFGVLINLINDTVKMKDLTIFFDRYKLYKLKFISLFTFSVMRRMSGDISDVFYFYRRENSGFKFFKNIHMLVYVCVRNSVKISYNLVELLYTRGLYEK